MRMSEEYIRDQMLDIRLSEPYLKSRVMHIGNYFLNRGIDSIVYGHKPPFRVIKHDVAILLPQLEKFLEEL